MKLDVTQAISEMKNLMNGGMLHEDNFFQAIE